MARHRPDWSKLQAVASETETVVRLDKDEVLLVRSQKIKGRFHSATIDSVTLKFEDGQTETFQADDVREVLTRLPLGNRWPGWVAVAASSIAVAIVAMLEDIEVNLLHAAAIFVGLPTLLGFYGSKMGGIYEIPPRRLSENSVFVQIDIFKLLNYKGIVFSGP